MTPPGGPPAPRPPLGWTAALLLLSGLAFFSLPALRPRPDADIWWHLRAGHDLLAGRPGVFTEAWSFTAAGRPWINHEWLAEGAFALADRLGGEAGVVLVAALLLLATGLLLVRAGLRAGVPAGLLALGLVLAVFVAGDRFVPRPQLFTYLLMAAILERAQALRDATGLRALLVFPVLQLFWANLHGPVPGLGLLALLVLGGAFPRLPFRDRIGLLLLILAASVAHPQGPRALTDYVAHLGGGGLYREMVSEWLPLLDPGQAGLSARPWTIGLAAAAVVVALLGLGRPAGRERAVWALLLLGLAVAPFLAVRNRDLLAIGVLPALAGLWPAFVAAPRGVPTGALLVAAGLMALVAAGVVRAPVGMPRLALDRSGFPVEGAAYLARSGSPPLRIVNSYDFGGYLVRSLPPGWTIFVDGRYFVYGEEHVRDYLALRDGHPGSREILRESGADLLFLRYPGGDGYGALAHRAREWPEWALVYWDDQSLLFARRDGGGASLVAARDDRAFDPLLPKAQDNPAYWVANFRAIVGECWRAAVDAPRSAKPLLALGLAFEYAGRDGDAVRFYRDVQALYPGHRVARDAEARLLQRYPAGAPAPTPEANLRAEFDLAPRPEPTGRE